MESLVARLFSLLMSLVDFGTGAAIGAGVFAVVAKTLSATIRFRQDNLNGLMPEIRLALGRWLALALELAIAADILRTVMVPSWDEIGKLAAIVVLRTSMNFF